MADVASLLAEFQKGIEGKDTGLGATVKFDFEGAGSDLIPSNFGSSTLRWGEKKLNELRDPCIYKEGDELFLLYSFNGEGGIALGSLNSYE